MIYEDTTSATSSLALEDGVTRFDWPAGTTGDLFGPGAAPASLSAPPAKDSAKRTNATSGLSSDASLKHAGQESFSGSKSLPPKSLDVKARDREYQRIYRQRNRARDLMRHARFRAHKKGLPFDLDEHLEELQARIDAGVCEVSGEPFNLAGGRTWDSPSLDRMDPSKGYLYSNIRVVLHAVNSAMGDWGEAKMLEIARSIMARRQAASNALSEKLGQRLKELLDVHGSPEYQLTWKRQVTPSGHVIYRLRASARRTSDSACGGWPTPTKGNADGSQMAKDASTTGRRPDGSKATVSLNQVAQQAGWPTARQTDGSKSVRTDQGALNEVARKGGPQDLDCAAHLAGWATPAARDWRSESATDEFNAERDEHTRGKPLSYQATQAHGVTTSGSPAPTGKRGALNPALSLWLQGYPPHWMALAPSRESVRSRGRAMPSSRKSRRASSKPSRNADHERP